MRAWGFRGPESCAQTVAAWIAAVGSLPVASGKGPREASGRRVCCRFSCARRVTNPLILSVCPLYLVSTTGIMVYT